MTTFAKPENALKRAEELMNVGQKQAALQTLHDLITSKRYRAWQKTLERIMFKYVELCVDMKKGRFAKDGLIQYRIICQQVNVSSLEEVIKYFLKLSGERAEHAQALAAEVTLDIEDLEAEKRPEDLMLSFVSGEKGKERSDRELVTPWFKFLWETYRTVLEILRNNSKLESLYAMTAHRAFQFCLQYKRTTEFRRLCEILRNHLTNLNKYRDQRDRPDLTQPESLQLYLETRFEQLKVATELELWQEAFRSVEDIHGLMSMVKKSPKPQMMAIYYAKLTKIFWVSESHLYHAYAWFKLYNLQKSYNKNLTQKDLQLMASSVLLATLSVTPYDRKHGAHHFELEMEKDRNVRMANLLGFTLDPKRDTREVLSRAALLSELVLKGAMTYVPQEVKDLFNLLENEFHPLDLAVKAQPLLSRLSSLSDKLSAASPVPEVQLEQYVPALQRLTTLRVLQQVSQVYHTMKIKNLTVMTPFFDFSTVERLAVDAVRYNYVQIRIDHLKGVVNFCNQDLEADKVKNHLTVFTKRLNKALTLIRPSHAEKASRQTFSAVDLQEKVEKEHKKLLARKVLIERRKEEQERQLLEMEREEESKRLKQLRLTEEAEFKRLANESARREEARIRKEIEEKDLEEARLLLAEAEKRKGKKGKKVAADGEVKKLTKQILIDEALSEQMKERQEMERKLQKLSKTMDHTERARREEERPLTEAAYQKRLEDDKIFYARQQELTLEQSHLHHTEDLIEKKRLVKMLDDKNIFQSQVVSHRQGEFERLLKEREERLTEMRLSRHIDCERRRKMECYRQQEEARLLKLKEEEDARKREEEERRRKEEAERRAKYDEIADKQRQREAEAEERGKRERDAVLLGKPLDAGKPGRFIPPSLRRRVEEPDWQDHERDTWTRGGPPPPPQPTEERTPPFFGINRGPSSRGENDRWQRSTDRDRELPEGPPPPGKYQPPQRSTGRYEPPVRRDFETGRRDGIGSDAGRRDGFGTDAGPRRDGFGSSDAGPRRDGFGSGKDDAPPRPPVGKFTDRYGDRDRERDDAPPSRPSVGKFSDRYAERERERDDAPRPSVGKFTDRYADREREREPEQRRRTFGSDRIDKGSEDRWSRGGSVRPT